VARGVYKVCPVRNSPEAIRRFFGPENPSAAARLTDTVRRRLGAALGLGPPPGRRKPQTL